MVPRAMRKLTQAVTGRTNSPCRGRRCRGSQKSKHRRRLFVNISAGEAVLFHCFLQDRNYHCSGTLATNPRISPNFVFVGETRLPFSVTLAGGGIILTSATGRSLLSMGSNKMRLLLGGQLQPGAMSTIGSLIITLKK